MKNINLILITIFLLNLNLASSLSVSVHVPEKYTTVSAGENFYFDVEVKYPENPTRKDLKLEYEIHDLDGNLIAKSKVLKAVETQASFIDSIVIPENAKSGLYILNIKISDYETLSEQVEASFNIIADNQIQIYFFILLGAIILVGILISIEVYKLKR